MFQIYRHKPCIQFFKFGKVLLLEGNHVMLFWTALALMDMVLECVCDLCKVACEQFNFITVFWFALALPWVSSLFICWGERSLLNPRMKRKEEKELRIDSWCENVMFKYPCHKFSFPIFHFQIMMMLVGFMLFVFSNYI